MSLICKSLDRLLLSTPGKRVEFGDKGIVSSYAGPVAGYSQNPGYGSFFLSVASRKAVCLKYRP